MKRSEEGEARRVAALRTPEVRERISAGLKGKTPSNLAEARQKAWAANRKETLTYIGIHAWVKRNWGKADRCELCGKEGLTGQKAHWANKDHKYSRERSDWMMTCRPCHAKYDQEHNGVSFANGRAVVTHCPRGHAYDEANTRVYNGCRHCLACAREKARERREKKKGTA